jgi:hypothetical protein
MPSGQFYRHPGPVNINLPLMRREQPVMSQVHINTLLIRTRGNRFRQEIDQLNNNWRPADCDHSLTWKSVALQSQFSVSCMDGQRTFVFSTPWVRFSNFPLSSGLASWYKLIRLSGLKIYPLHWSTAFGFVCKWLQLAVLVFCRVYSATTWFRFWIFLTLNHLAPQCDWIWAAKLQIYSPE